MAGVSARTLRHYDDVGVLIPAAVSTNGYRWYGRDQLRRLQRILLLRELDVPLPQIKTILAGEEDEAYALRRHLMLITAERDRLARIAATIIRTVEDLERTKCLADEEFFRGLDEKKANFAETLLERFGGEAGTSMEATTDRTAQWTRSDYDQAAAQAQELYARLSHIRRTGAAPTSPVVLDLIGEHYTAVLAVWPVEAATYYALADLIETDPDQRDAVAAEDPDLPVWFAAAIRSYATARLHHLP